jgi:probable DNA metabolism protein
LPHFESRYADQEWIIFDLKRKYGLHYNLHKTNYITLELPNEFSSGAPNLKFFDASEHEFQQLWQQYFKSTNIKSRRNTTLHLQHVPKRYWKYLTEKNSLPN